MSFGGALHLADVAGRLNVVTTTFDWNDRYNLWSGLIGGTFLALAYFGTDQTQVQRYFSGESIRDSRRGLMFNAAAKIPMQLCILFIGVLVFVFYVFTQPPMLFQRVDQARLEAPALRHGRTRRSRNGTTTRSAERRAAAERVSSAADGRHIGPQRPRRREAFGEANRALERGSS